MSATDDDKSNAQHTHDETVNPFVSFRRFADEQMSSLLHSLVGLPSAFSNDSSSSRRSAFDEDVWLQEARQLRQHLARESHEVERIMSIYKRAYDEAGAGDDEDVSVHRCPYRPFDSEMLQDNQRPTSEATQPDFEAILPQAVHLESSNDGYGGTSLWPIAYIAGSSYSPLRLERVSPLSDQGHKWRNAFEDLIAVKNGKPMVEEESRNANESSAAWMSSMVERGLFGSGWKTNGDLHKNQNSSSAKRADDSTKEDEITELDLYERFLGSQFPSMQKPSPTDEPSSKSPPPVPEAKMPNIISTLTTTERNTLPDGSTHTKVVLKKRFSDGREESTETVHTTYDSRPSLPKPITSSKAGGRDLTSDGGSAATPKEPQKKGWFWS